MVEVWGEKSPDGLILNAWITIFSAGNCILPIVWVLKKKVCSSLTKKPEDKRHSLSTFSLMTFIIKSKILGLVKLKIVLRKRETSCPTFTVPFSLILHICYLYPLGLFNWYRKFWSYTLLHQLSLFKWASHYLFCWFACPGHISSDLLFFWSHYTLWTASWYLLSR